ncbi:MAG: hypothetical protein ACTHWM_07640 [Yaniella sp.]|uniref:hypothetical protein n=1 Tax=Yaniella sp. TaxID=2773929 RepID=UPI003F9B0B5C
MSPEEVTTSPQKPDRGKSASGMGIFGILGEIVGVLLALFIGFMFLLGDSRADAVAWILFGIGALMTIDLIRRIVKAVRV